MAEGFRAAQAFVEVSAEIDDSRVLAAARRAASQVDAEMQRGTRSTGKAVGALIGADVERGTRTTGRNVAQAIGDGVEQNSRGIGKTLAGMIDQDVKHGSKDTGGRVAGLIDGGLKRGVKGTGGGVASLIGDGAMKIAPKVGMSLAGSMAASLTATLGRSIVAGGPTVGVALLALSPIIVGVASSMGAMASAALISGLGLAAMGAGIAMAFRSEEIKEAAAATGERITDILERATTPFQGELLKAFALAEGALRHWEPQIKRIFAVAATFVEPLTRGITMMIDKMLPGMTKAINAIQPAISAIGIGLSWVGREIGYLFKDLSDNGPELVAGITMAFALLAGGIRVANVVLNVLVETFGWFMEQAFKMGPVLQGIGAYLQTIPGLMGEVGTKLVGMGTAINDGAKAWDGFKDRTASSLITGQDAAKKLIEKNRLLKMSMSEIIKEVGSLSKAFDKLNGIELSAHDAEVAWQAALDSVTKSIKDNGRVLNDKTDKGRANDAVMRQLIDTSAARAQALYNEAEASGNVAKAERVAHQAYVEGREQLIKAAMAMGKSRAAATAYVDELYKIPAAERDAAAAAAANNAELNRLVDTTRAKTRATYDEMVAKKGSTAAEAAAKKVYEDGRAQLIKTRMAMGDSRAEAVAYANKVLKIPKKWSTAVALDTGPATKKLETFMKKVTNADGKVVNVTVRVTTKGDHYIPGVGTQLKAAGGWIMGGSGTRDDVPVLAMGGEFMLRRRAASALERQFGKGFLDRLNWWDRPGSPRRPNVVTREPDPMVTAIGGVDRPDPTPTFTTQQPTYHFAPGAFTVDLSRIKDVGDLVRMVQNLTQTARAMGAAA